MNAFSGAQGERAELMVSKRSGGTPKLVTLEAATTLARELAMRVRDSGFDPHLVIGIANGGAHPAYVVAQAIGRPCQFMRVQRTSTGIKQALAFARVPFASRLLRRPAKLVSRYLDRRLKTTRALHRSPLEGVSQKRVLLVDDCIDTGASIALAGWILKQHEPLEVRTAVLSWMSKHDSMRLNGIRPDYFLTRSLPAFPWSLENPQFAQFRRWLRKHA